MKLPESIANFVRLVAGVPKKSPFHEDPAAEVAVPSQKTDELTSVGCFTTKEFEIIRKKLEGAGVTAEIKCDTSAAGVNLEGLPEDRNVVQVFVEHDCVRKAVKIIDDWRVEVGRGSKRPA